MKEKLKTSLDNYGDIMTVEDMAELLGCTKVTIYKHVSTGILPAAKIGRKIFFYKKNVVKYIKQISNMK